ncbi:hypothetical protein Goshw_005135, partial [Gossypium schwendimanii]|nr:hypothetical protein [Gossypium schwendimanii]
MFKIELKATFIIVESNGGVDAETFTEVGRIISHAIHEFLLEDLINDGNGTVLDMLNSMRVPVQTSTVEEIAASVVRMAAAARDRGSKVLRMWVGIETVVDDVPDFGNNDTDDDDDDDDGDDDDDDEGTVRAEQATEKLVKLMVEESGKDCVICLEELAMGSEAICTPCSHAFHDICIADWLKNKKRCPCCHLNRISSESPTCDLARAHQIDTYKPPNTKSARSASKGSLQTQLAHIKGCSLEPRVLAFNLMKQTCLLTGLLIDRRTLTMRLIREFL